MSIELYVNTVTNCGLIDEEFALKYKSAGINIVQISIDRLTAEGDNRLKGKKSFKRAVRAVKCFVGEQNAGTISCTNT